VEIEMDIQHKELNDIDRGSKLKDTIYG